MSITTRTSIDQILFFLFVRLVDQEQAIGLRDIERLDRLLAKPQLLGVPALDASLHDLAQNYQAYWRLYQEKKLAHSNQELRHLLAELYQQQPELSWGELKQGLQEFIRYFAMSSGLASKLRLQKSQNPRRLAIAATLSGLLDEWHPHEGMHSSQHQAISGSKALIAKHQESLHQLMQGDDGSQKLMLSKKGAHRLVCTHVRDENTAVKTFTFVKEDLTAWVFAPGQFMTFEIPSTDGILRRSYSISSSPFQPYAIEVTVKQVPEGIGSAWFHQNMVAGREITAHGPHGNFSILDSIKNQVKPKIALFAAGVGITPLMSMLQWLIQSKQECDVVLINRLHSHADLIFSKQLTNLAPESNQVIHQITISTDPQGQWPAVMSLCADESAKTLKPEVIQKLVPDMLERDVYLCGPDSFKDSVVASLNFLNFDHSHFYSESFGGINQKPSALTGGDHAEQVGVMVGSYLKRLNQEIAPEDECFVEFKRSGKTVRCAKGDLLLEVAEFNGINIPNSCRSGSCGTCKCRLEEGVVAMDNEDGLTLAELASGSVLSCVGHIRSKKVVIDA